MTIYKFAGFWRRLTACFIDGFIITIVFLILTVVAGFAYFALQAQAFGRLADTGHGRLRELGRDLAGEQGAQNVGADEGDAGFAIEGGRHVGDVVDGRVGAQDPPVVVADLAAIHGAIGAADSVVLDVVTSATHIFFSLGLFSTR